MRTTELTTPEDRQWLLDTHLRGAVTTNYVRILGTRSRMTHVVTADDFVHATLYGNEDAPVRVELFKQDHYRCRPWVFTLVDGKLQFDQGQSPGAGKLRPRTGREREAGML